MIPIIKPKAPIGVGWFLNHVNLSCMDKMGFDYSIWLNHEGFSVISSVEVAEEEKNGIDIGPVYHISITKYGKRCTSNEAKWVCQQFGMQYSEEDNHVPHGVVRNFWLPVAEKYIGHECKCKKTESPIKENKGDFIWRGINK